MSRAYQFSEAAQMQELTIERFAGVDFANHPTKTDVSRSPDACNMIADETYFPVKRTGYQTKARFDGQIYGLHRLEARRAALRSRRDGTGRHRLRCGAGHRESRHI